MELFLKIEVEFFLLAVDQRYVFMHTWLCRLGTDQVWLTRVRTYLMWYSQRHYLFERKSLYKDTVPEISGLAEKAAHWWLLVCMRLEFRSVMWVEWLHW